MSTIWWKDVGEIDEVQMQYNVYTLCWLIKNYSYFTSLAPEITNLSCSYYNLPFLSNINGIFQTFFFLLVSYCCNFRSNDRRFSQKKGVLKNFQSFTEKQLFWSLFLIRLQTWGYNQWQKLWEKMAIWTILCFSRFPPLSNVEEQWTKLPPSNVMGSQHCIGGEGEF